MREVETMSSANIQFKALLVGIVIGAIAGIAVYIIVRALGIKEAASGAIIGGIAGAISVTRRVIRPKRHHQTFQPHERRIAEINRARIPHQSFDGG